MVRVLDMTAAVIVTSSLECVRLQVPKPPFPSHPTPAPLARLLEEKLSEASFWCPSVLGLDAFKCLESVSGKGSRDSESRRSTGLLGDAI